jgi:hypothetical protein
MRTIRMNVFETNSSSEHAFTYPKGTEPTLRDKSEFPLPDENGLLEIELDTFWDSCNPKCCTDDVKRIIQYFAAQSIYSVKVDYVKDKHGKWESIVDKDVLVKNHTDFLEMLNIVYKEFGLPEIKDYRCYVLTVDGDKVIIDGYEKQDYRNCEFEPECMSRDEYDAMLARFHKDSDYPDCPKLAHYIGISANCLREDSFIQAFEYLDPVDWRDDLYKKKHDMPLDILRKRITLTFWHS